MDAKRAKTKAARERKIERKNIKKEEEEAEDK
jgi:hypothetical protein